MKQKTIMHNPTLETIKMVERTIYKHSQECGKYQLWKKLPKKVQYQTYLIILDYLSETERIILDDDGCIIWTWDPKGIEELKKKNLKYR